MLTSRWNLFRNWKRREKLKRRRTTQNIAGWKQWSKNGKKTSFYRKLMTFRVLRRETMKKKTKKNKGKERMKSRQQIIITFTSRWSLFCRCRKEKENITGVKIEMEVQRNILKHSEIQFCGRFSVVQSLFNGTEKHISLGSLTYMIKYDQLTSLLPTRKKN